MVQIVGGGSLSDGSDGGGGGGGGGNVCFYADLTKIIPNCQQILPLI